MYHLAAGPPHRPAHCATRRRSPTASPRASFRRRSPDAVRDETGLLLRSMAVMQQNIRDMVEREQAQRRSAQKPPCRGARELARSHRRWSTPRTASSSPIRRLADFFPTVAPQLASRHELHRRVPSGGDSSPAAGRWCRRRNRRHAPDGGRHRPNGSFALPTGAGCASAAARCRKADFSW